MVHRFYHQCLIIDNSVVLKSFIEEEFSSIVDDLVDMSIKREVTFLAPSLLIYEFFNVISRAFASFDEVQMAFQKFRNLNISLMDLEDEVLISASNYLFQNHGLSYYDAVYHSLAKDMDAIFLTADKKYYDSMKSKGNIEYLGNLKVSK